MVCWVLGKGVVFFLGRPTTNEFYSKDFGVWGGVLWSGEKDEFNDGRVDIHIINQETCPHKHVVM
jgi:hypothetical protein